MSCHKAVCQECATTWDGIHYCAACLTERRRARPRRADWLSLVAVVGAGALIFWTLTRLMVWAGVLVAGL